MPDTPDFPHFPPIPPQPPTPRREEETNGWWLWQMIALPGRIDRQAAHESIVGLYSQAGKFHLVTAPDQGDLQESRAVCSIYHDGIVSSVVAAAVAHPVVFEGLKIQDLMALLEDQPVLDDLEGAHLTVHQYFIDTRTLRKGIMWRLAMNMVRTIKERAEADLRTGNPDPELLSAHRKIQQAMEKRQEHIDSAKDKVKREDKEKEDLRAQIAALQAENRQLRANSGPPTPPAPMPNPAPDAPRPPGPAAHGRRLDR